MVLSTATGPCLTYYGSPERLKTSGVLVGVASLGRSWKWGCRGRSAPGFKPRCRSHVGSNHVVWGLPLLLGLGSGKARCSRHTELSLSGLGECRKKRQCGKERQCGKKRYNVGRKGVKGLWLVGHEKVPHGFLLRTGDHSYAVAGAGNQGRPAN